MKKNNILKLMIAVVLCLCLVVAFIGCSGSAAEGEGGGEDATVETTEATEPTEEATEAPAEYDISEGMTVNKVEDDPETAIFVGNGFELTMPNTGTWSYEATTKDSVRIFHMDADSAGFGGTLVTIMAMDMDDTSYEEFPAFAIAGESEALGKRFIAMFPTDLQCNPEDETQAEEYPPLSEHVHKIDMNSADSPFTCTK